MYTTQPCEVTCIPTSKFVVRPSYYIVYGCAALRETTLHK